jgi:CBS domain-containing protein
VIVSDVMSAPPVTALPTDAIASLVRKMLATRIGSVVVVDPLDPRRPVGIVTRSDLQVTTRRVPRVYPHRRAPMIADTWVSDDEQLDRAYRALGDRPAHEAMSAPPVTIAPGATLWEATELMLLERVGHVPVTEDEHLVGVLSRLDLLACVLGPSRPGGSGG